MPQLSGGWICRLLILGLFLGFFVLLFIVTWLNYIDSESIYQKFPDIESKLSSDVYEKLKVKADRLVQNGEHEKAIQVFKQIHNIQSQVRGPEDENTLKTLDILASLHIVMDNFDEALALYWQVYKIQERTLGATHADTLTTLQKLAQVYHQKGNYPKAIGFFKAVYKQRKLLLGPEHVDTMEILFLLGNSLWDNQRAEKSSENVLNTEKVLKYYAQVYKVYSRTWGENNDKTLRVLSQTVKCLMTLERFEEAVPVLQKIMKVTEENPGSELYEDTEKLLGLALTRLGRMEEAREIHKKARWVKSKEGKKIHEYDSKIRAQAKFTPEVEDQINAVLNLAKVAMAEGNLEKAREKLEEINSIIENEQSEYPRMQEVVESLMKVHGALGNFKRALEFSVQHFHLVLQHLNVESADYFQMEKVGYAFSNFYTFYSKVIQKYQKQQDPDEEEELHSILKEMSEILVQTLEPRFKSKKDGEESPVVLKSLAMAAFLTDKLEIASLAASKIIPILEQLKRTRVPKRSDEEIEKINKEINVYQKMLGGRGKNYLNPDEL